MAAGPEFVVGAGIDLVVGLLTKWEEVGVRFGSRPKSKQGLATGSRVAARGTYRYS